MDVLVIGAGPTGTSLEGEPTIAACHSIVVVVADAPLRPGSCEASTPDCLPPPKSFYGNSSLTSLLERPHMDDSRLQRNPRRSSFDRHHTRGICTSAIVWKIHPLSTALMANSSTTSVVMSSSPTTNTSTTASTRRCPRQMTGTLTSVFPMFGARACGFPIHFRTTSPCCQRRSRSGAWKA